MNQAVVANIRLSLGLLKMIVKIQACKSKLNAEETSLQNCNLYEILVQALFW